MDLLPTEVYYHIYTNNNLIDKWGEFYIGNGDIFIKGTTYVLHGENNKVKLELTFINSSYVYNTDYIISSSYETIHTAYYDTIDDAINKNEMLKYWNQYKDYKCNKKFIASTTFKINYGNLLNKIQYSTPSLVDIIIYNKKLKKEDMIYVPFSPKIREKINLVYNEEIFDMNIFNISIEC